MVSKKSTAVMLCLLGVAGIYSVAQAGDMEPPGPPAPTMVTLQEIYDRVSAIPVGITKTGQTDCWSASGTLIACAGTGQDGEYQNGVSVSPRFTDNGDGTVKDNLTGLIWLQAANCFGIQNWTNALSDANTLASGSCGLTDGSATGDWRLPNVRELQSLIDFGQYDRSLPSGHPFTGVGSGGYWSSTTFADHPDDAWYVNSVTGHANPVIKSDLSFVWPVRGGQ